MSIFSIILLVLLAVYIGVWALDRFVVSPRRDKVSLEELKERMEVAESRIASLLPDDETDHD